MTNHKVDIVGIRSKSTSKDPRYFFSVECEDKEFLQKIVDLVKQNLWVYGVDVVHVGRYHDGN